MMTSPSLNTGKGHLVLRYDDYGAAYLPSCPIRLEVERMLHRETLSRKWPWLCAVTPRQNISSMQADESRHVRLSEDPARVELLREMVRGGFCEPAVHGLTHHTWKQLPRYGTEFAGLTLEQQVEILRTAKQEVEAYAGRSVSVLVPPWNSYDATTVQAAERVGLKLISSGLITYVPGSRTMPVVPATVELIHLRQIMDAGFQYPPGSVLVILMHPTDFVDVDPNIGYLKLDDFAPLVERALQHFQAEVTPVSAVPQLLSLDLAERSATAAGLVRRLDRLSDWPLVGSRLDSWLLPRASALLPPEIGRRTGLSLSALVAAWLIAAMLVALVPAWLATQILESQWARSATAIALACLGIAALAYCGRNAYLKRFRRQWGAGNVGLRTWTGVVMGVAMVISALWPLVSVMEPSSR